jgi:hypothetical protein
MRGGWDRFRTGGNPVPKGHFEPSVTHHAALRVLKIAEHFGT